MSGYNQCVSDFKSKKILIMGLGVQGGGMGALEFFQSVGGECRITDLRTETELAESLKKIDRNSVQLTLGRHEKSDIDWCDCIIRNPAVPRESEFLLYAKHTQKPVYMEAALFAKYAQKPIIGITGTRGKTTTTTLIFEILNKQFPGLVTFGGNIPNNCALRLLQLENQDTIAHVLELSSWQLQGFDDLKISPQIAVLTNIYPDHLNKYASMQAYSDDKSVITKYQTPANHLVYRQDDPIVAKIASLSSAQRHPFTADDIGSIPLKLPGLHNRYNASAAMHVAQILGIDEGTTATVLANQSAIPFRLETIAFIDGVEYVNDTTSTTPVALMAAIDAYDKELYLIVGGQAKKLPTDEMIEKMNSNSKVKGVILIPGTGTDEIREKIAKDKILANESTLEDAVRCAQKHAKPGQIILFSPGFTSFDQYRNEFDRGRHFNQIVSKLA